jgi:hypothetical protein
MHSMQKGEIQMFWKSYKRYDDILKGKTFNVYKFLFSKSFGFRT